ncbi:hypothetical protein, partial [Agathobacter rectalis]|uniref:hypothetical protein n=1 Tax=Agathobacter rectalis TaxID=39491 RepID=UPI0027F31122|nr:hypothetical protein [Agathobacter rectalis]
LILSITGPLDCPALDHYTVLIKRKGKVPEPFRQRLASGTLVNTMYIVTDFTRKGQHIFIREQ